MRNIPIVTKNLLIVNVVVFLLTFLMGKDASGGYALNDIFGLHFFLASDFQIYQLFTYMFMHGGFEHILFNMFALWMFGCVVERVWGAKKFLFLLHCMWRGSWPVSRSSAVCAVLYEDVRCHAWYLGRQCFLCCSWIVGFVE